MRSQPKVGHYFNLENIMENKKNSLVLSNPNKQPQREKNDHQDEANFMEILYSQVRDAQQDVKADVERDRQGDGQIKWRNDEAALNIGKENTVREVGGEDKDSVKIISSMSHTTSKEVLIKKSSLALNSKVAPQNKSLKTKVGPLSVMVSVLERAVFDLIRRMAYYKNTKISDGFIQKMALNFRNAMGLRNFLPNQSWCDKFRETYHITRSDSEKLNIAYKRSHSIRIHDVLKDVRVGQTPDETGEESMMNWMDEKENDIGRKDGDGKVTIPSVSNAEVTEEAEFNFVGPDDQPKDDIGVGEVQPPALTQLQNTSQIVTLPPQIAGPCGSNKHQKVLIATPVTVKPVTIKPVTIKPVTIKPLVTLTIDAHGEQHQSRVEVIKRPAALSHQIEIKKVKIDGPPTIQYNKVENAWSLLTEFDAIDTANSSAPATITSANVVVDLKSRGFGTHINKLPKQTEVLTSLLPASPNSPLPSLIESLPTTATASEYDSSSTFSETAINDSSAGLWLVENPPGDSIESNFPPARDCDEARRYLKLVENFALLKENFRLISLITRADEILREIDDSDDLDID